PCERRRGGDSRDRPPHAEHTARTEGPQVCEVGPGVEERPEKAPVRGAVDTELLRRLVERALEHDGGAVVERVRERCPGMYPVDVEVAERRRGERERVNSRADVVDEARQ